MPWPSRSQFQDLAEDAAKHLEVASALMSRLLQCKEFASEERSNIAATQDAIDEERRHVQYDLMPVLAQALELMWDEDELED